MWPTPPAPITENLIRAHFARLVSGAVNNEYDKQRSDDMIWCKKL